MANSEEKKSIEAFELERSTMIRGDVDPKQEVTGDEFQEIAEKQGYVGVAIEARREWLEANDHEVTRENMMDDSLTPKEQEPTEDESATEDENTRGAANPEESEPATDNGDEKAE